VLDRDVEPGSLERTTRQPRNSATGPASSVRGHGDDAKVGSCGLLHPAEKRDRDIALEVALVEFVEQNGRDAA